MSKAIDGKRLQAFVIFSGCCVLLAVGYAVHAARRTSLTVNGLNIQFIEDAERRALVASGDYLMFRTTAVAQAHGRLVASPLTGSSRGTVSDRLGV